jgi:uncharacterized protein (DUF1501 family)
MKRRDFMRMTATAGGFILCGGAKLALAQQAYSGPFWLFVEASGGWDPTSFCDPKGVPAGEDIANQASLRQRPGILNTYYESEIGQAGNIRYAATPLMHRSAGLFSNADFFDAHFQNLVVVNGINYGTNSHQVGRTASWTGSRALDYPSIAALVASETAGDLALPMVASSSSESSKTNGIVPRTLVSGGDLNAIREIAHPHRTNANDANGQYHSDQARGLIDQAAQARRIRQMNEQRLLRVSNALAEHNGIRNRDVSALRDFVNALNNTSSPNSYVNGRSQARNLFNSAQTAFAAFESGAAATGQIRMDGFDTHDDHDSRHYPRLMDYLATVDNIITDAQARGIADRLIIVMGSDFARTNKYNDDNGKDHWSHTSMMVYGSPTYFSGNRVVGGTDDMQRSRLVNPTTLAFDNNGIEMTPEYMHQALRGLAGIDMNPNVTSSFPFAQQVLPIFS